MQTAVQIEYEEKHEGSLNKEQKFFHENQSMPSTWSSPKIFQLIDAIRKVRRNTRMKWQGDYVFDIALITIWGTF